MRMGLGGPMGETGNDLKKSFKVLLTTVRTLAFMQVR